ncbi:FAD-binding and (Fe-S)-binding domain-containing protein [Rhizobium sp. S152]|uniref:FAD-binding and (Fe-S)-binding domain-containing protein n=1 Tax=Rhizobium sp. S152 TaxID=3055038 RepID=UPI0025A9329E|nr:FAD-binding and (Fe-S)-binding domain-containing protein [Rhizobium sp. S152]MDM9625270.1 FAD-binding and (Fe-S)-binding domain-containing protein [Rhizobium sp. S152]
MRPTDRRAGLTAHERMPEPAKLDADIFTRLAARLAEFGFSGTVHTDAASRAANSTDNSVYQIIPEAVIAPRDSDDVRRLLEVLDEIEFASIPITARGGGTGTNGQSLNQGVIVDFRRHMNRVIHIDVDNGFVDVEPGIVLDDLNRQLAPLGLFFGPNTSTSNRCTIGGMIGTDASGKGSRIFGKTADNVLGLKLMLAGGRVLDSQAPLPDWAGPMMSEVAAACDHGRAPLLATVPKLSRRFSGLDLERARPSDTELEWWRLAIGAEGVLGLVTKARLKLTPLTRANVLLVIGFDSFASVLNATQALLPMAPLAIEVMDEWVQGLAQKAGLLDVLPPSLRGGGDDNPVYAFVEFAGDNPETLARSARSCLELASTLDGYRGSYLSTERAEIASLWSVRAASVGLLGAATGERRPISFVEDCVVPPDRLSAFVDDFKQIMSKHSIRYGIYGHADVGCLHTRPALDMADRGDRQLYQQISDEVYEAACRHGGIFWGEHGKGIRGEYLEKFVGPQAFAAFKRIKRAFDPAGIFNPGKLVSASGTLYGIGTSPMRVTKPAGIDPFKDAFECNGNALCLNYAATTPMCPSFKVTGELRHSPKGRAEALRAWRQARQDGTDTAELDQDVFAALDGCLGCKSCAGSCPTHVDIPEMKSRFLEDYYRRNTKRLSDRLVVLLERLSPLVQPVAPLLSRFVPNVVYDRVAAWAGIVDAPRLSARSLGRLDVSHYRPGRGIPADADLLLLQDPFTSLFDIDCVADVVTGLKALGLRPALLPLRPAGKAAHVKGDRRSFGSQARSLAEMVVQAAEAGLPIVGMDPAVVYMFRSEFLKLGLRDLPEVLSIEEYLLRSQDRFKLPSSTSTAGIEATIFLHCTEKSMRAKTGKDWQELFERLGAKVSVADTGCCGMSGVFGHETRHQDWSKRLFDMSWRNIASAQETVYATGFSCRCQTKRYAQRPTRHPMALVASVISARVAR